MATGKRIGTGGVPPQGRYPIAVSRLAACPRCRALLEPTVRRCPYCGTDQRRRAVAAPQAADAEATTHLGLWILAFNVAIFALMVLAVGLKLLLDLVVEPAELYSLAR